MSTASRVVKNTGFLYAKMGITMFISLWITRLILNSLGASDFGIFNIIGGAISMLGFLGGAMTGATQRFMSYSEGEGDKEKQKSIFNISLVIHTCVAIAVGLLLLIAGFFFFNGILNIPPDRIGAAKVVYGSLIVSTMFTVMTVPYDAAVNAHENMKYYAVVGIIESLLKLGVAFITVYTLMDKLIVYGILMALIPILILTIMIRYCRRHYEECTISPHRYWNNSIAKEMTTFAGWNFLGTASSMIANYGTGIVLNHFFGPLLNAAQGIAGDLNGKTLVFSNNMLKALNPVIAKNEGAGERQKMVSISITGNKFSFYAFAIIIIPIIIETPFALRLWLKNVPEWAVIFVRLLLIRTLVEQTTITFGSAIAAEGHISQYNKLSCIIDLATIASIYLAFLMGYSPTSMYVIAIFLWGFVLSGVKLYIMKKNCGMSLGEYFTKAFLPMAFVFGITLSATQLITGNFEESLTRLILTIGVSTTIFLTLWAIIGITREEQVIIKQLVKQFPLSRRRP